MNKKERLFITSSLIALWVIAKYNSAIAETLNKDKKINETEQTTNLQEQTNNELNLNLMSPPDTIKHVKDIFYSTIVETAQEKIDADKMRNNAMNGPYRDVTKKLIVMVYSVYGDKDKYSLLLLTTLLLDPKHQYWLSQQAYNIVEWDKGKKMVLNSLIRNFAASVDLQKSKEDLQNLKDILEVLEKIEQIYKNYIKTHKVFLPFI